MKLIKSSKADYKDKCDDRKKLFSSDDKKLSIRKQQNADRFNISNKLANE